VCPLGLTSLTTRNVFDWLHPDLSAGSGRSLVQLALFSRATGTPFHNPSLPARHGDGSPLLAISRRTGNSEKPPTFESKALVTNLCNRLVVNEHPPDPPIPRQPGSHRTDRRFRPGPADTHPRAHLGTLSSSTAPDSRKRHLRPHVVPRLASRTPAAAMVHRSPARGCLRRPLGPDMSCTQPFDLGAGRVAWPLTLPVMLTLRPGFPAWLANTEDPFHGNAPTSPLSRPEVPSAYESPPPHLQLALEAKGGAAAGTSALPLRPSVRHAFTRRLYALDPITLPVIHRSSWATCRSSTSAIEWTYEHNLEAPRPLNVRWQATAHRVSPLLRDDNSWASRLRGHPERSHVRDHPHRNLRSCSGFTPSRLTQTPPVAC
jgi:hypothetical protein